MKIAFIGQPFDYFAHPVQGGSLAIWTYQIARRLVSRHDVTIYARQGAAQAAQETHDGLTYRRFDAGWDDKTARGLKISERLLGFPQPKKPAYAGSLYYAGYIRQAAAALQEDGMDAVHLFNFTQQIPIIRAQNPSIKIAINMQCEWLTQLDYRMIDARLAQVDFILGCSDYITDKIRMAFPHYADRCFTIFNGADEAHFTGEDELVRQAPAGAASNGSAEAGDQRKQLIFVGRISPEKGLHVLLAAMQKVVARNPNVHLAIVGPPGEVPYEYIPLVSDEATVIALRQFYRGRLRQGAYQPALDRLAAPIADHVTFTGSLPHTELTAIYQRADILINPSLSESFGMTLVEAMASNVPVIATRVGGMPEIVQEGVNGLLVEPGDVDALALAILALLEDDERRADMSRACRQSVVGRYTWDGIANRLESIMAETVALPAPAYAAI